MEEKRKQKEFPVNKPNTKKKRAEHQAHQPFMHNKTQDVFFLHFYNNFSSSSTFHAEQQKTALSC